MQTVDGPVETLRLFWLWEGSSDEPDDFHCSSGVLSVCPILVRAKPEVSNDKLLGRLRKLAERDKIKSNEMKLEIIDLSTWSDEHVAEG